MASTAALVKFVVDQLGPGASAKAMFGEYGLYVRGVLIGLMCDDRVFIKPTSTGAARLGAHELAPPYPGAKPSMLVPQARWDDQALMTELATATAKELASRAKPKPNASSKPTAKSKLR